jgi:alanyl-tRNA synthetase
VPVDELKTSIQTVKEMFIVLDHTRTVLITISDGSLPSNVGGGGNVRNILRRAFAIMKQRGWWDAMDGMNGFIEIFEQHKADLEGIYGKFPEYKSFR